MPYYLRVYTSRAVIPSDRKRDGDPCIYLTVPEDLYILCQQWWAVKEDEDSLIGGALADYIDDNRGLIKVADEGD